MKAAVLARGLGRRMRAADPAVRLESAQSEAADAGSKAMMPLQVGDGTKHFLDFVLASLMEAGLDDMAIVVGPDPNPTRRHYEQHPPADATLTFLVQHEPLGTADAVVACQTWADQDPFVVLNADNLYPVDVLRRLAAIEGNGLPVFERGELSRSSNIPHDRIASFALIEVDEHGRVRSIVEKPGQDAMAAAGPRALISMNVWRFDARIFNACRDVPQSVRGEYELPAAVALAIDRGVPFSAFPAAGPVLDLSRRSDVAEISRRLSAMERPR